MIPLIMGVLNVTPDSFSDGGRYLALDAAVERAHEMVAEGADIIDVGGESTRPGATPVDRDEELRRVLPVIEALSESIAGTAVRISIDSRHAEVVRAAVEAGASLVNDVSASLWQVAADTGVGWIAMHMAGDPASMQDAPEYRDVVAEVRGLLLERAASASAAGVAEIWIDPGIGFGKTFEHNVELLACTAEFVGHEIDGRPIGLVIGTSRKSVLGQLTAHSDARVGRGSIEHLAPIEDRLPAALATATWAMAQGAGMIRTHDVRAHVHAARVVSADIGAGDMNIEQDRS